MSEFASPDWDAPLDVGEYLRATPKAATIKGMFLAAMVDGCRDKGRPLKAARERYVAFQDYPLTEHLELLVEGAPIVFPGRSLRRALRSIGRASYPTFSRSLVGRVMFGGGAVDVVQAIEVMSRGYEVSMPQSKIDVLDSSKNSATLRMSGMYTFFDSHHVGVFEGVTRACGAKSEITVRLISLSAGDMRITW